MSTTDPTQFRMTFTGHLDELRRRLVICVVALLCGMAVSYALRDELFAFILHPLFVARENTDRATLPERDRQGETPADAEEVSGPAKAARLAARAQAFSKRAIKTDDPLEAARLAAKAAAFAAKAVTAIDQQEARREDEERLRRQRSIAYTNPVKPFWVSLQLALVGGICLSFGVILWEIWAFVAPGLYPKEKRYALPFVAAATGCFLGGAGFGYRYVFPVGFGFLVRFSRDIAQAQGIEMMDVTTVDAFVSIALKLLLAFGLIFELPVVISFLAMAGVVDHKQLWRFGRWFMVISVLLGALLTPPDVISQVMMAVPMAVLYLISIGLAYLLHPSRRSRQRSKKPDDDPGESGPPEESDESSSATNASPSPPLAG